MRIDQLAKLDSMERSTKLPKSDPCMVVIGTDLFVIGGTNHDGIPTNNTWGYRLTKQADHGKAPERFFEIQWYLMNTRTGASCIVDKYSKDVWTIGGNKGPL